MKFIGEPKFNSHGPLSASSQSRRDRSCGIWRICAYNVIMCRTDAVRWAKLAARVSLAESRAANNQCKEGGGSLNDYNIRQRGGANR